MLWKTIPYLIIRNILKKTQKEIDILTTKNIGGTKFASLKYLYK